MQPGDAIIHDRYCFHKPDAFNEEDEATANANSNKKAISMTKQRISLRYMPSDATFYNNGKDVDGAATRKQLETGDPLSKAGEYFPQVWPSELETERQAPHAKQDAPLFGTKMLVGMVRYMVQAKMTSSFQPKKEEATTKNEIYQT